MVIKSAQIQIAILLGVVCLASVAFSEPPSSYGAPPSGSYGAPPSGYSGSSGSGGGYGSSGGGGSGGGYGGSGGGGSGGGYGGRGHHEESYPPRPYKFNYAVNDHYSGANFRQQEASDGNRVNGQYTVLLPDGRTQIVTYNADWKNGFNAEVTYQGEAKYPEPPKGQGYGAPQSAPAQSYGGGPSSGPSGGYSG